MVNKGEVFYEKIALGFLLLLILAVPCTMLFSEEIEIPVVQPQWLSLLWSQSPGALMFRLVCVRNQITCVQEDLLTAEQLAEMVAGKMLKDIGHNHRNESQRNGGCRY